MGGVSHSDQETHCSTQGSERAVELRVARAEHRYVCGKCEKPYGKTRVYDYGMLIAGMRGYFCTCVRCEDLYTVPDFPKMRLIDS